MGTTKVKFHPFSMIVPPKWLEFHGQGRYTTPMVYNGHGDMENRRNETKTQDHENFPQL